MDDEKKRNVMIIVMVCCLIAAAGIFYFTNRSSGGGGSSGPLYLLCANQECKHQFEMSSKDYAEKMQEAGPDAMMMGPMMGPVPIECPQCSKKTAYIAEKCPSCGTVFFPNYNNTKDYPDRCPSCKHSEMEDRSKQKTE